MVIFRNLIHLSPVWIVFGVQEQFQQIVRLLLQKDNTNYYDVLCNLP